MTTDELKGILKEREKRTLEYKRAWAEVPGSLYETVCAFLNRDGGTIVLGVEDDRTIPQGVNPKVIDQLCKNIANMSNNPQKLSPTFLLQPEIVDIENKKVIVISVPSSSQVHHTSGRIYDRSADGDFELKTDAAISALYLRKSQQYSENQIYPYVRLEHMKSDTIEKAKNLIRNTNSAHPWLTLNEVDFFRQANLFHHDYMTDQEGFTLAALMLFGKTDVIQSVLPYYRIDAVVRLEDTDRYDDRLSLYGNIIDDYEALMEFLAKHLPDNFYQEGDQRISLRDKIFREIVANMLVHREYQNAIPTILEITKEGIIAKNANRPLKAGPVTLANYTRYPKNPHIANFFVQIGRAEHLGTGIRNIYKYTPIYTGKQPQIDDEDVYTVHIPLPLGFTKRSVNTIQKDIQKKLIDRGIRLSRSQFAVAVAIAQNPSITRMELVVQLGMPEISVTFCISRLKEKGVLVRKGGRRYGEWLLTI